MSDRSRVSKRTGWTLVRRLALAGDMGWVVRWSLVSVTLTPTTLEGNQRAETSAVQVKLGDTGVCKSTKMLSSATRVPWSSSSQWGLEPGDRKLAFKGRSVDISSHVICKFYTSVHCGFADCVIVCTTCSTGKPRFFVCVEIDYESCFLIPIITAIAKYSSTTSAETRAERSKYK